MIQNEHDLSSQALQALFGPTIPANLKLIGNAAAVSGSSRKPHKSETCDPKIEFTERESEYSIVELPSFGALTGSPNAINNIGQVVGECTRNTPQEAVLWISSKEISPIFEFTTHS